MEARSTRLLALKAHVENAGGIAEFSRRYDVDAGYMWQLLNGRRPLGERAARKLEKQIGLAEGDLERPPQAAERTAAERRISDMIAMVPDAHLPAIEAIIASFASLAADTHLTNVGKKSQQ